MNGLPRHETPTATSAVEGAEPRIVTRDEEDRGATPGVRWCRRRPGPSRSRREPVATPWRPAPEPAGRGSVGPGAGSDRRGSPTRRGRAAAAPWRSAEVRSRHEPTPERPKARSLGRWPTHEAVEARSERAGPRYQPAPRRGAEHGGVTRPGHEPPHAGLVRSGADDTRAFREMSRRPRA